RIQESRDKKSKDSRTQDFKIQDCGTNPEAEPQ
ncbi:unnamed protein product, partial [marine sediment metagenome]